MKVVSVWIVTCIHTLIFKWLTSYVQYWTAAAHHEIYLEYHHGLHPVLMKQPQRYVPLMKRTGTLLLGAKMKY